MSTKINKKSMMFEFFLRLIIALIIFIPTVYFFASLFRLSASALDDYNNLDEKIKQISTVEGEYKDNAVLRLDKETAIISFKKDLNELGYTDLMTEGQQIIQIQAKLLRPDECRNEACMCLCRKVKVDLGKKIVECNKRVCNTYENIDFIGKGGNDFENFVIETFSSRGIKERINTVYIHKYNDFISVCLEQPCITDEMKNEIDKNVE